MMQELEAWIAASTSDPLLIALGLLAAHLFHAVISAVEEFAHYNHRLKIVYRACRILGLMALFTITFFYAAEYFHQKHAGQVQGPGLETMSLASDDGLKDPHVGQFAHSTRR